MMVIRRGTRFPCVDRCFFYALLVVLVFLTSCSDSVSNGDQSLSASDRDLPELLIFTGITMTRPINDLAQLFEERASCRVTVVKGGSGNLLRLILHNRAGDLYLPGSERYFAQIEEKEPGLIVETLRVGHNRAVLMVREGNPLGISSGFESLADPRYRVVIGDPSSGSIGRETRKILEKRGLYRAVVKNAMYMTTDSKDLVKALLDGEADLVMNWYAAATWEDHPQRVDVLPVPSVAIEANDLQLGLLRFSRHPELARSFLRLAGSEEGSAVFRRYGLSE